MRARPRTSSEQRFDVGVGSAGFYRLAPKWRQSRIRSSRSTSAKMCPKWAAVRHRYRAARRLEASRSSTSPFRHGVIWRQRQFQPEVAHTIPFTLRQSSTLLAAGGPGELRENTPINGSTRHLHVGRGGCCVSGHHFGFSCLPAAAFGSWNLALTHPWASQGIYQRLPRPSARDHSREPLIPSSATRGEETASFRGDETECL